MFDEDDHELRQAKLNSVDYLMLILIRLKLCSEFKGMRIFQEYRQELFYRHRQESGKHKLHLEKIISD